MVAMASDRHTLGSDFPQYPKWIATRRDRRPEAVGLVSPSGWDNEYAVCNHVHHCSSFLGCQQLDH